MEIRKEAFMEITLSKRLLAIIVAITLFLSILNTFLIFRLQNDYAADDSIFSYVVFSDGGKFKAKNQTSGLIDLESETASILISQAVEKGNFIFLKSGVYPLTSNVLILNKRNTQIVSDGATILGNGFSIIIKGDNYSVSQYNSISGLKIANGTVRIENSFATTVSDMIFEDCPSALELINTETWTEGTKIDNIHFINCIESIAFRSPTRNATGSYASTEISRCFFNQLDNSIGINVEKNAELSDSRLSNSRLWLGENGKTNQIGLLVNGAMFQTFLSGVVFESFALEPEKIYAIVIGETANPAPTLDGVSFLGNWTARIHNPGNDWLSGDSVFRRSERIPVGTSSQYGETVNVHARPVTISSFKPRIQVQGTITDGETITVRVRLESVDNVISPSVEKTFTNTTTLWLSDDDMLTLFPSQNVIWAILIDAKSNRPTTSVSVQVDMYGTIT